MVCFGRQAGANHYDLGILLRYGAGMAPGTVGKFPDALIPITGQMIEAGVTELREMPYGRHLAEVVEAIYLAMELERRAQDNSSAFLNNPSK